MIVSTYFPGDDNNHLQWFLHDCYGKALGIIVKWCRNRYLSSVRDLDMPMLSQNKVSSLPLNGFDHRTLQLFHDFLAASFRFYNAEDLQPKLPFPGEDEEKRIKRMWFSYLENELERLSSEHKGIVKNVIEAVCYSNPNPIGIKAEDKLAHIVINDARYDFLDAEWKKLGKP